MPHRLIAGKLHPTGIARLRGPGVTFDHVEDNSEPSCELIPPRSEGVVIRTELTTAAFIAPARALRIVSYHGVGQDAVDVVAQAAWRIPPCVAGDVNSGGERNLR